MKLKCYTGIVTYSIMAESKKDAKDLLNNVPIGSIHSSTGKRIDPSKKVKPFIK